MPTRLPVFPLSVVLFPGTLLPLHIFEPRYRRMLADCLAADRRFGITPSGADGGSPDPGMVGCIAEVRGSQELPDGRSTIMVLGRERFVVARRLDEPVPYDVASVETFEDTAGTDPSADRVTALRASFLRYAALVRELGDRPPDEPDLPADAVGLSFHAAAGLEVEAPLKQQLLAERSTARRVDLLLVLLPQLTDVIERALAVHRQAHTNGRGHAHPSLPTA